MTSDCEAVSDRHPLVEDETLPVPEALRLGDPFEIPKDAALEVIHLPHADLLEIRGRFLASNATDAERRDPWLFPRIDAMREPGRQLTEGPDVRVDRVSKRSDLDFVVVSSVDHDDLGIADQFVPVLGGDVGPGQMIGVDPRNSHGDSVPFAGDGRVDSFFRQEDDSSNPGLLAARFDPRLQRGGILESDESVEGGDDDFGHAKVLGFRILWESGEWRFGAGDDLMLGDRYPKGNRFTAAIVVEGRFQGSRPPDEATR